MVAPPRWLVLLAGWSNILAGLLLIVAFTLVTLALTFQAVALADVEDYINGTFFAEGIFWALAAGALAKVNLIVNNSSGAVAQTIIVFGGIFFAISGMSGVPAKVIDIKYLIPSGEHVQFADACPYYGITCFMVATAMSLSGVWPLPKDNIVSPFWGVACFFTGAWLIGIVGFWGPMLAGGSIEYEDLSGDMALVDMPTFKWTWIHIFQLVGAVFLAAGCFIFGALDNIFCFRKEPTNSPTNSPTISPTSPPTNS